MKKRKEKLLENDASISAIYLDISEEEKVKAVVSNLTSKN